MEEWYKTYIIEASTKPENCPSSSTDSDQDQAFETLFKNGFMNKYGNGVGLYKATKDANGNYIWECLN